MRYGMSTDRICPQSTSSSPDVMSALIGHLLGLIIGWWTQLGRGKGAVAMDTALSPGRGEQVAIAARNLFDWFVFHGDALVVPECVLRQVTVSRLSS
jgi:hypothetical protein